jgi:hypothetical protein
MTLARSRFEKWLFLAAKRSKINAGVFDHEIGGDPNLARSDSGFP